MRYFSVSTRYATIASEQAEYAKQTREHERQRAYERNIVRSVPVMSIEAVTEDVPSAGEWKPG